MSIRKFWSPGIAGFILIAAEIALWKPFTGDVFMFLLFFVNIPVVTVLCMGAFTKVVRSIGRRGEEQDPRPLGLRLFDMLLGLVAVSFVALMYLGTSPAEMGLLVRILLIIVLLLSSVAGYLLFTNWRSYNAIRRRIYVAMWIVMTGVPQIEFLEISFPSANRQSQRDAIINDLYNLAADAYQHRLRPLGVRGGGGSYVGFLVPAKMASNEYGVFSVRTISPDTVVFSGAAPDRTIGVTVKVGADGRLFDWQWWGEPVLTIEEHCEKALEAVLRFLGLIA